MKKILLKTIKTYQHFVSPYFKNYFGGGCRFFPSCSQYSYSAIEKHGVIKGFFLSVKRIFRCNLLTPPCYDPVR